MPSCGYVLISRMIAGSIARLSLFSGLSRQVNSVLYVPGNRDERMRYRSSYRCFIAQVVMMLAQILRSSKNDVVMSWCWLAVILTRLSRQRWLERFFAPRDGWIYRLFGLLVTTRKTPSAPISSHTVHPEYTSRDFEGGHITAWWQR